MKTFHKLIGSLAGIAMLIILLISAFEIGAYSDYGWYESTYAKYDVLSDLEMKMGDVMDVTKEMLSYLRGNREDLVVETVIDGRNREFFNEREKAHMLDVQNLFIGGLWLRRGAIVLLFLTIGILWKTKGDWKQILPKTFLVSMAGFIVATLGVGTLFLTDFTKYFTLFHELFFDNDLWLLDPNTDLLIRMLPEGFFLDMVIRIGIIFLILLALMLGISIMMLKFCKNKEKKCTNEEKCDMIRYIQKRQS